MFEGEWIPTEKPLFMVRICINKRLNTDKLPSCGGRGSRGLAELLEHKILEHRIPANVVQGPCMNNCLIGPNLKSQGGLFFNLKDDTSAESIEEILAALKEETARRRAAASGDNSPPES